jgi:hypothetical protein
MREVKPRDPEPLEALRALLLVLVVYGGIAFVVGVLSRWVLTGRLLP